MAVKTFTTGEVLTAADTNTYLNNGGLVYVTSQTIGSAVTTLTINNAFSATYDSYRIIISGVLGSVNTNLNLRISGSTGSTYLTTGFYMTPGSTLFTAYAPAATTEWVAGQCNTNRAATVIDIFQPFAAQATFARTTSNATTSYYDFGLADTNAASSTGFTIFPSAGNLTGGTITVYGYRKA